MRLPLLLAFLAAPPLAQPAPPACDTPAHAALDFWVGDWALTWTTADGDEGRGTNAIARTLGGCVVHERFESADGFAGESVSVYDPLRGVWRQTWVDNRGGYLLLTGGPNGNGAVELRTDPFTNPQTGREQVNRMTWPDVSDDTLTWRWQRSTDGGVTWEDRWTIRYARR